MKEWVRKAQDNGLGKPTPRKPNREKSHKTLRSDTPKRVDGMGESKTEQAIPHAVLRLRARSRSAIPRHASDCSQEWRLGWREG